MQSIRFRHAERPLSTKRRLTPDCGHRSALKRFSNFWIGGFGEMDSVGGAVLPTASGQV